MLGWEHVESRDYAESVVNGLFDDDLERMIEDLQRRVRIRDGAKVCPDCGEIFSCHVHDDIIYLAKRDVVAIEYADGKRSVFTSAREEEGMGSEGRRI